MESTGVQPLGRMRDVTDEIAASDNVQTAVAQETLSVLRQRLETDPDYEPEKMPNARIFLRNK